MSPINYDENMDSNHDMRIKYAHIFKLYIDLISKLCGNFEGYNHMALLIISVIS